MPNAIKLSVNLSPDVVQTIRELAAKRNVTMTEIIRDAIGTEKFITEAIEDRSKILIEDQKGKIRQVLFR